MVLLLLIQSLILCSTLVRGLRLERIHLQLLPSCCLSATRGMSGRHYLGQLSGLDQLVLTPCVHHLLLRLAPWKTQHINKGLSQGSSY